MVDPTPYITMAVDGGAAAAKLVATDTVVTAAWVPWRCQYGCGMYGRCLTCPPHAPTPEETRRVLDKMNSALYNALNEAGIGIPFPQRDLHLVSNVKVERINGIDREANSNQ